MVGQVPHVPSIVRAGDAKPHAGGMETGRDGERLVIGVASPLREAMDAGHDHGYIVPGLGDFGDRLYGTE